MSGILKNSDKTKNNKNKNAFSPVPSADSFPWKKVGNDNSNLEELKSKIEPPKMEKKKETLYSAYDSFLDDKRNTFLSESSYNFDTLNRTSYIEEEYEPIVENQMAIITNEQPKPQRYSMLSALAPLTKRVSLDKPKLTQESQTQDSLRYSEEETSSVDYSYVSYESDYEAIDDNAQPIVQNQLDVKSEGPKGATTKSLEKKIEENIEKYKEEEVKVYESDSDSEIEEEDFSLRFQRDSVRDSKDIVAEAVAKKLKEVNEKEQKEKEKETEKEKEKEKEEKPKSKGQIEREKAAKEAKAIEALKPSYVEQTNIKPTINELTPQMVVDAEKDASKTADESITNIKPQFVKNATIQPNVASLTSSMIKPPTQSIYLSSKEISNLSLGDVTNDNILADLDSPKLDEKKGKGKGRSDSDEEFYKTQEGNQIELNQYLV
ncbi:hypothetical protein PIROE2DRAFT_10122 [Piromyces sp. E2]|nr:hypothetical protein PIROE2DRAFT_10122 [Piromyces sp. E2]|eukprot:OUM63338.1 hypothetical protein PIROE2DRAFT_10122 [Piromyces sp. E2]